MKHLLLTFLLSSYFRQFDALLKNNNYGNYFQTQFSNFLIKFKNKHNINKFFDTNVIQNSLTCFSIQSEIKRCTDNLKYQKSPQGTCNILYILFDILKYIN